MKNATIIMILALFMGCQSIKNGPKEFTITRVQQEKDGQTLFLKDHNDQVYTTVISIPSGNFIKVNEGDRISMEIEDLLETDPPIIISKHIKIIK